MADGVVLDSFALLAYLQGEQGALEVKEFLRRAASGKFSVEMTVVNLGEVYYITARSFGKQRAEEMLAMLGYLPIKVINADRELTLAASRIKAEYPISYADAFAAALAQRGDLPVVTGDPEFSHLESTISVIWMGKE
ncbi:hypothetical protein SY88_11780 [Clostridiales bacterium PH28_bin88]|nr:hypothetical protein SY88_11780 [Clostridiales bacterium PH28_bin88]